MQNMTDQYCISLATSKGGFSFHPGNFSRKCHLCHGSCKSRIKSEAQGLLPRVTRQSETFYPRECGCALTFAGIMFLCIWISQLYMLNLNKRPLP